jgi:histidinol-phosphate/aromatic aminotransferase/cobyric acid decarboxylase-like protein
MCSRKKKLVRCFPDAGVRVTVGRSEDIDAFAATLTEWRT